MEILEAVIVYDGHGVTTKIRCLTTTAMRVHANVTPAAGDTVTVFIAGVGKMDSWGTYLWPPRIDLSFLTDTQERWRQLHLLRQEHT